MKCAVTKRIVGFLMLLLAACGNEMTGNKYCSLYARFSFAPVSSISQLFSSCNSPGEWCAVVVTERNQLRFTKSSGDSGLANITADTKYFGLYPGLSGLIVGLPNIPEVGEMASVVTCYDLACRNCYEERSSAPRLTLQENGYACCSKCGRTYSLNNAGQVEGGTPGKPLYRYRVYYGNNTLTVSNP